MRESRSPARLAGVSTVMRTLPPSRPKDINVADAVVMKVRGDCTRYGKSNLLFNSARSAATGFSHPTLYQSKATHHHHGQ